MIGLPIALGTYFLFLFAIFRHFEKHSALSLILRATAFIGAVKTAAIVVVCLLRPKSPEAGTGMLYLGSALLFPEWLLTAFGGALSWSTVPTAIALATLFSFLWASIMVSFVYLARRQRSGALVLVTSTALAPPFRASLAADAPPAKTIKIVPTSDVVVIGWADPAPIVLPEEANPFLKTDLNDPSGIGCDLFLSDWYAGIRTDTFSNKVSAEADGGILFALSTTSRPITAFLASPEKNPFLATRTAANAHQTRLTP